MKKAHTINVNGTLMDFHTPMIMGILNITPDSFYSESRVMDMNDLLSRAEKMLKNGADILDIGGYSSRPGAEHISEEKELERVIPVIKEIKSKFPAAIISIDTFRSGVAKAAVENGADLINDISGGDGDSEMFQTVKSLNVPYVIMHMQGTPQSMQINPSYKNVVQEVYKSLNKKINELNLLGVADVIVDMGFGFGKNIEHNYTLLQNIEYFHSLNCPVLVGLSRKSMIYKPLNSTPEKALIGTIALNTIATLKGANILRVHDVKETREMIQLYSLMKEI